MDVTIREDDQYVYADIFNAEPERELYVEMRSTAVAPNESTEGVSASLHRTVGTTGTTHFKVPRDYLLPDAPREVTVIGPIATEVFTT